MGANAVTTVPVYTAGEVLTAEDMNITNSGIPVFATTVTRDAAFGGAGEKTLAEGQFAYIEATNTTQYYDGSAWQSVGVAPGMVLVAAQTIGSTVGSVAVTGAFSATYDNYKITISGGVGSTGQVLGLQLGATTTGYYAGFTGAVYSSGAASTGSNNNAASWTQVGVGSTDSLFADFTLSNPFASKFTFINSAFAFPITTNVSRNVSGYLNNTTSYTGFTITPDTGTMTGGTIRVYGYANS